MTGNNKFWRASLAGLASVAMLATMGVSAANAVAPSNEVKNGEVYPDVVSKVNGATYKVKVYKADEPYTQVGADVDAPYGRLLDLSYISNEAGKVFDYASYDQAGEQKVPTEFVVTGDVKLYAHYKDAVTVYFDVNNTPTNKSDDKTVKIEKGTALTAAEYAEAGVVEPEYNGRSTTPTNPPAVNITKPSGYGLDVFAGWTTDYTKDASTSSNLYTGAALNEDTVLYTRWDNANFSNVNTGKDLATVKFVKADNTSSDITTRYTLNGKAFPAFRAPTAAGTWKTTAEGAAYDFSTPVENKDNDFTTPDLTLRDVTSASATDVTVKFDAQGGYDNTNPDDQTTTSDQKLVEPTAPVKAGAVFTGWYLKKAADGQSQKYDFSKSIAENWSSAKGEVQLYAGWDTTHVAAFVFNPEYKDWTDAQQVWFVRPGSTYDLPKLWDYYQTTAQSNAAKGEFTSRNVTSWTWGTDTVTKAKAGAKQSVTIFTANWDQALSVKLDANGGKFGSDTVKWVTKNPGQSWADVVVTPTKDGYSFVQWRNLNEVKSNGTHVAWEGELRANLSDGYWYNVASGSKVQPIADGDQLKAEWKQASVIDIEGLRNRFFTKHTAADRTDAIKTVANFGYTEESAAKYVDAVNALEPEYEAYTKLSGIDRINAANALAPKYQAAEALLVKSDVPVEPAPAQKVPVYRLYNPGMPQAAQHFYTASKTEYDNLVTTAGWQGEGIAWYTTDQKTDKPVYRLYSRFNSAHFYTTSKAEYDKSVANGWTGEDVAWYVADDADTDVYRLYNDLSGEHLYTTNAAEKDDLVANAGWTFEQVEYKVYAK